MAKSKHEKEASEKEASRFGRISLLVLTSGFITLLLSPVIWDLDWPVKLKAGDLARHSIRSPLDISVIDQEATERRRNEASSNIANVFVLSPEADEELSHFFSLLSDKLKQLGSRDKNLLLDQSEKFEIEKLLSLNLVGEEWALIFNETLWVELQQAVSQLVQPILKKGIIADKQALNMALARGKARLSSASAPPREILSQDSFYDINEAKQIVSLSMPPAGYKKGPAFDSLVKKFSQALLKPNVRFNSEETDLKVKEARDSVQQALVHVQMGQLLVKAGSIVNPEEEKLLGQINESRAQTSRLKVFAASTLLLSLLFALLYSFLKAFWPHFEPKKKDLVLLSTLLITSCLGYKLFYLLSLSLSESFASLNPDLILLLTPLAAAAVIIQAVTNAPALGLLFTLSFTLAACLFVPNSYLLALLILSGGILGSLSTKLCASRSAFFRAGLKIGLFNMLLIACYYFVNPPLRLEYHILNTLSGLGSGVLVALVSTAFAPLVEFLGRYVSGVKLLELASLDRPLLRELSLQAPGTWNHSMVVAQLAETAAEAIGANPLLTRVGAFYHDIGKANKPAYFIENQSDENRHDKLTASMSALIIKAHVKDGVEMARAEKLPQPLIDFILEHHGNSLMEYFYEKAQREAQEGDVVDESHYRYPGPRPQTKETGIVMLADAVEAASRTIKEPTPAKIQGLVQKIINKVFASGELNECNITLRDLHCIAKSFTRCLSGIYHKRIDYAEPAEKVRAPKLEADIEVSKTGSRPESSERQSSIEQTHKEEPLKRLGIN